MVGNATAKTAENIINFIVKGFIMAFIILGVFLALIINLIIASEMKTIVEEKGYSDSRKYFWYAFLFGIAGCIIVIALPNKKQIDLLEELVKKNTASGNSSPTAKQRTNSAQPTNSSKPKDPPEFEIPRNKQSVTAIIVDNDHIQCPNCGFIQDINRSVCWECGTKLNRK